MFSAASTALTMGSSKTDVLRRMVPVSGASRASIGKGCGHTVGWESQCWPIETQAKPMCAAARDDLDGLVDDLRGPAVGRAPEGCQMKSDLHRVSLYERRPFASRTCDRPRRVKGNPAAEGVL